MLQKYFVQEKGCLLSIQNTGIKYAETSTADGSFRWLLCFALDGGKKGGMQGKHIGCWCRGKDRRSPVLWEEPRWQIGHMSCRPQSRMQGCFIIPLHADEDDNQITVCQSFHQWQWWWGQCIIKVHHPNGAITKCPIAPPANAPSAGDISSYTKIHYYSSSRTIPSRSVFAGKNLNI